MAHVSNEKILDSTGPYSIPLKMLTVIPDLIIMHLAFIINMSFLTGAYADLLRIVKVTPIHEGGSTQDNTTTPQQQQLQWCQPPYQFLIK